MKNKYWVKVMALIFLMTSFLIATGFSSNNSKEVVVKRDTLQVLNCQDLNQSVIKAYTDAGWHYNNSNNRLERTVAYANEEITVEGRKYKTDSNGKVKFTTNSETDGQYLDLEVKSLSDDSTTKQSIEQSQIQNGQTVTIQETVNMDRILANMDDQALNTQESIVDETGTQVGGLSNGQLPKHGQYVHCNRFNGYLGNGRYYSKSANPIMAARNFIQSDCDVSLANSTKCLADYGSNPYCSTKNTSTAGKCSPNIVNHSRLYHKHTGWFSPSK